MKIAAQSLGSKTGDEVATDVRSIVAKTLGKPIDTVRPEARLESGLGVDSMAMIDISVGLEERFEIALPPFASAQEARIDTVADLVRLVARQIEARAGRAQEEDGR